MFKKNIVTMSVIPLLSASLLTGCPTHSHDNPPAPQNTNNDEAIHKFVKMLIEALEKKNDTAKQAPDKDTDKVKDQKKTDKEPKKTDKKDDKVDKKVDKSKDKPTTNPTPQKVYTAKDLKVFYNDKGLAGFKAKKGGKVIIPAEYDYAENFKDGVAIVRKAGKWDFINAKGISLGYDDLKYVGKDGLLKVKKGSKWGVINKQGQTILPIEYDELGDITDKLISAKKGDKWGYINKQGQILIDFQYQYAYKFIDGIAKIIKENKTLAYINSKGQELIVGDKTQCTIDKKNHLVSVKKRGKYGLFNTQGRQLIDYQYDDCIQFNKDLAIVKQQDKYGLIDKQYKFVLQPVYDEMVRSDEYIRAVQDDKYTVVDNKGKVLINSSPQIYKNLKILSTKGKGLISFRKDSTKKLSIYAISTNQSSKVITISKYGLINFKNEIISQPQYSVIGKFPEYINGYINRAYVVKDDKYGFIDDTGKLVINIQFDDYDKPRDIEDIITEAEPVITAGSTTTASVGLPKQHRYNYEFRDVTNPVARVKKDGVFKFIDKYGKTVSPYKLKEGLKVSEKNGKWGFVNSQGKVVIDYQYDDIGYGFHYGLSAVKKGNVHFMIDKRNTEVSEYIGMLRDNFYIASDSAYHTTKPSWMP